jgi:hypothetical protein
MPDKPETNYERQVREEYALYSPEMDLWNTTLITKLNQEDAMRKLMEKLDAKAKLS